LAIGTGVYIAAEPRGVKLAGLGLVVLSIIPAFMADSDYWRAVDLYNTRFQPSPSTSQLTIVPYLAAETRGGTVGVSGRF
jgi:hypothetical protein